MDITIEIDEELWQAAEQPPADDRDPIEPIRQLIEKAIRSRLAMRRLAALGGTMPDLEIPPRRRPGT